MKREMMVHQRKSLRLKDYNYSSPGYYFVTVCTKDRQHIFGNVTVGAGTGASPVMTLNGIGLMVKSVWEQMPNIYPGVQMDEFIIMPNHVHGIIVIVGAGLPRLTETMAAGAETAPLRPKSLGQIVAYFKYQSTKRINEFRHTAGIPVWQRNYYERVIRSEHELNETRQYILDNPAKWDQDPENVLVSAQ